jgi:L-asparaginase II
VVTPEGELVARLGDASTATFLRSAAKPFQCLPLLAAGGERRHGLEAADLAVICASHSGTPAHVAQVESLLARGGLAAGDLACGAHAPFDRDSARALRRGGGVPTALHNNCSGKHAGMLLACRLLELPTAGYTEAGHPLQQRILAVVAALCGVPEASIGIGIDGCSVPCYRMPLAAAARGYAALGHPAGAGLAPERAAALGRIVRAMTGEPEMVAGAGRFTTRLMQVTGGRVLGKEGAEGFYAVAVRGPVALGLAIKIADGAERCRDAVVIGLLRQLGSLSGEECAALADLARPQLHNWRGLHVGEIVCEAELEMLR